MTVPEYRLLENNPALLPAELDPAALLGENATAPADPAEPEILDANYVVTELGSGNLLLVSPGGVGLGTWMNMAQVNLRISQDLLDPIDDTGITVYEETGIRTELVDPRPVSPDPGVPVVPNPPYPLQP